MEQLQDKIILLEDTIKKYEIFVENVVTVVNQQSKQIGELKELLLALNKRIEDINGVNSCAKVYNEDKTDITVKMLMQYVAHENSYRNVLLTWGYCGAIIRNYINISVIDNDVNIAGGYVHQPNVYLLDENIINKIISVCIVCKTRDTLNFIGCLDSLIPHTLDKLEKICVVIGNIDRACVHTYEVITSDTCNICMCIHRYVQIRYHSTSHKNWFDRLASLIFNKKK